MVRLPPPEVVERDVLASLEVRLAVDEAAAEVVQAARDLAAARAYDLGDYEKSIRVTGRDALTGAVTVSATDRKSKWLEEGTGIYGPSRSYIRPKRARFLVFQVPPRSGNYVYARKVRGRPASWVMRDAGLLVASRRRARFSNLRSFQG